MAQKTKLNDSDLEYFKYLYEKTDMHLTDMAKEFDISYTTLRRMASNLELKRERDVVPAGFKRCFRCKLVLPIEDFGNYKRSPDGKFGVCKECETIRKSKYNKKGE